MKWKIAPIDVWLALPVIGLSLFSIFTLIGLSADLAIRQGIFIVIGVLAYVSTRWLKASFFKKNHALIFGVFIALLLFVFFAGDVIRGSRRWIDLYFFRMQPSEIFKPFFLVSLAAVISQSARTSVRGKVLAAALFLVPMALIFRQPDLGNAIIYAATVGVVLYLAQTPLKYFVFTTVLGVIIMPLAWRLLAEYQKNRLLSFIDPDLDPQGISYNAIQSIATVGSGGWLGHGLGLGSQSRLQFLPENHTDFIFASLVEQFGLVGGMAVIILSAVLISRLILLGIRSGEDKFGYLLATGAAAMLTIEMFINIGMNMGIVPVTGITLPLLSYGGSSVVSTFIMIALVASHQTRSHG